MKKIAIIIPSVYPFSSKYLQNCLNSIYQTNCFKFEITIIVHLINFPLSLSQKSFEKKIRNKNNFKLYFIYSFCKIGFPQAINNAIFFGNFNFNPDWYLIINDDALLDKNYFIILQEKILSKNFAVLSSKVINSSGKTDSVGLNYYRTGIACPRTKNIKKNSFPIFCGTCFMLSKKTINKLISKYGFVFNEIYFAYSEDLELSLRILKNNGKIFISNQPLVIHLVSKTNKRGSFFQLYHSFRNWFYTIIICWPLKKILINLPFIFLTHFYIILFSIYKKYFFLYFKIIFNLIKNIKILYFFRRQFDPNQKSTLPF